MLKWNHSTPSDLIEMAEEIHMGVDEFREATEHRKKSELPDDKIEDAARNEISRRSGEGNPDAGAARQQTREGSDSLCPDVESNSLRRDVQRSDANPDAAKKSDEAA